MEIICLRNLVKHCEIAMLAGSQWVGYEVMHKNSMVYQHLGKVYFGNMAYGG